MALNTQQNQRRAKYGVNVAVALIAAFALVLLVNWFAAWAFARLPESARPWLRYDLTATRANTLSEQTQRVLASAANDGESIELVGVFASDTPQARAVEELLDEYASATEAVSVRRFDPQADASDLRDFYTELAEGLGQSGQTQATRAAIDEGAAALAALHDRLDAVLAALNEAEASLDPNSPAEVGIAQLVDGVAGGVLQFIDEGEALSGQLEAAMDEPLPNLSQMQAALSQRLQSAAGWSGNLRRWLRGDAQRRDMPAAVRDAALRADRQLEGVRESLEAAQSRLASVGVDAAYRRLRDASSRSASVLVRRGQRVRAVNLDDMFVADEAAMEDASTEGMTAAETLPVRFLGEERLTGAIVSVSLERPPLLIFVSLDGKSALGRNGTHNVVAERVRSAGFEVASYPVVSDAAATALNPAPALEQGRRVVWFVPAADAKQPTDAAARAHLASILDQRLQTGDGVLMTPGWRVSASVVAEDPLLALANRIGIGVDAGSIVLALGVDDAGASAAMNTFRVQAFAEHALTAPLNGRSVWLALAHPVTLSGGAELLMGLQADGLWVESNPPTDRSIATATAEEFELAAGAVPVAAVAEVESAEQNQVGRLAVVADALWSTDTVIVNRQAEGNVELFANLTYWLAGLDEAIAATARSQGVRRIGPMSEGGRTAAVWLAVAGWPVLALVAGTAVWAVRRRS
ncbi:MAG: hypothetical protein AAGF84_06655 [Planctomycetota bacterium]